MSFFYHSEEPGWLDDYSPAITLAAAALASGALGMNHLPIDASIPTVLGLASTTSFGLVGASLFGKRAHQLRKDRLGELCIRKELPTWLSLVLGFGGYVIFLLEVAAFFARFEANPALAVVGLVAAFVASLAATFAVGFRKSIRVHQGRLALNYSKVWERKTRWLDMETLGDLHIRDEDSAALIFATSPEEELPLGIFSTPEDAHVRASRLSEALGRSLTPR